MSPLSPPKYPNKPVREPDLGDVGRAWRVKYVKSRPDHDGALEGWLVDCEGFGHPYWPWYLIAVVHLRPIPGARPVFLAYPEATHEIQIVAMNPREPLPDVDAWSHAQFMLPPDLAHQFTVRSDEQARELGRLVVQAVVGGQAPDEDNAAYWMALVNSTAEHICYGCHPRWN